MRVAVIPARGGSKRVPRKNIREFAGKPMIAHSIGCAVETGLFEKVIVSTDSDEVASIARDFGAETPFVRPPELADDQAGTTEVIAHAVAWLNEHAVHPSAVCCIYATAPFLSSGDLKEGLTLLETGQWDYVFSATKFDYPIQRSFRKNVAGGVEMFFPEHFNSRSQDLPEALHDAAQFYWGRPEAWLRMARIFDVNATVVIVPRWRVQDIDTEEDWIRAQAMTAYLPSS